MLHTRRNKMLQFTPETEEELLDLMPDGEYDFYVKESEKYVNQKNGNQSIKLTLGIINHRNIEKLLNCYLSVNYKLLLKHFCDATGLEEHYKKGTLSPEHCKNQSGKCKIITEIQEGTNYPPKNVIRDFVKRVPGAQNTAPPVNDFIDDTIPF